MSNHQYFKPLDGLRAIAVLAVIIYHFDPILLPGGFLGVDVFFVISGFVITASLLKRETTNFREFIFGFYKRRLKRLYPGLLLMVVTVSFFISFFNPNPNYALRTGLFAALASSNISLYVDSVDYWGNDGLLNPFTHTWSLGVEEQFYLIFPLLIYFLTIRYRVKSFGFAASVLVLLTGISLIGFLAYPINKYPSSYYFMPFRFWEIGAGAILYLFIFHSSITKKWIRYLKLFYFPALIVVFFIPEKYVMFSTIVAVTITGLIIADLSEPNSRLSIYGQMLSARTIQYVGKLSYSLYLWHWPVIVLAKWTVGVSLLTIPFLLVLIIGLSVLSFLVVEKPFRYTNWRVSLKVKLVMGGLLLFLLFFVKVHLDKNYLYTGNYQSYTAVKNNNRLSKNDSSTKIRVLGNSHGSHILPMLNRLSKNHPIETIYSKRPHEIVIPSGDQKYIHQLDEVLSSVSNNDLILLSNRNFYCYQNPFMNMVGQWKDLSERKKKFGYGLNVWLCELELLLNKAQDQGVNVIMMMPNVEFDTLIAPVNMCHNEWFRTNYENCFPTVSMQYLKNRFSPKFYEEIDKKASLYSNFYLFDPLPIFCPDMKNCSRMLNGVIAFRDTNHLTPEGSLLMLEAFENFLIENQLLPPQIDKC